MAYNNFKDRSWVEIDLDVIRDNYRVYKALLGERFKVIAVVKADAYGHGDTRVAELLENEGVKFFAVSNIDEAIVLRRHGISGEILVLGYTPPKRAKELLKYNVTQAIISYEYASVLIRCGAKDIKVHVAVDTGMNRIGINGKAPESCADFIRNLNREFNVQGIFTHLSSADGTTSDDREFTQKQIETFAQVANAVSDMKLPYVHCLNSAGGIGYSADLPKSIGKIARLGILLYGLSPYKTHWLPANIMPALTWKTVISMIKTVPVGEHIGYGRSYKVRKEMRLATLTTGYADGYNRALSNIGYVAINGKKAPIVGRISMDQMTVDVTDIPNASIGTEVILIGCQGDIRLTADVIADMIGSIGYEVVCDITKRVKRVYLGSTETAKLDLIDKKAVRELLGKLK